MMGSGAASETISVEVVFATPGKQRLVSLEVSPGSTVAEVVSQSGLAEEFPDSDLDLCPRGIWGQQVPDAQIVAPGDRVEIYRPLVTEPREARRQRALEKASGKSRKNK